MGKIKHDFVSDIDIALAKFNEEHAPSVSQQREIDKHADIFNKRPAEKENDLWD